MFVRAGRRSLGLTPSGELALPIIDRLLQEAANLRRVAASFVQSDGGMLTVAATTTRVAFKRGAVLRAFVLEFIQTLAPTLTRDVVAAAALAERSTRGPSLSPTPESRQNARPPARRRTA